MNEQQRVSFELLEVFVSICEKWEIPYFLVCGSALGAVKYGGFIPWDDDVDVGLLRKDYQRFMEVAPQELPQWCFLQNYKTDKNFPLAISKLRNSNTTFIEAKHKHIQMHHGIYMDIFPLDGHPAGWLEKKVFAVRKKMNDWVRLTVIDEPKTRKGRIRDSVLRFFGFHKRVHLALARLEKLFSSYPPEESELWCNYGNWQGKLEYAPKWQYGKGTWATFEGLRVRIPENYDAYLTQKYGDWRSDPPQTQKTNPHKTAIMDAHRPYAEYFQLKNDKN